MGTRAPKPNARPNLSTSSIQPTSAGTAGTTQVLKRGRRGKAQPRKVTSLIPVKQSDPLDAINPDDDIIMLRDGDIEVELANRQTLIDQLKRENSEREEAQTALSNENKALRAQLEARDRAIESRIATDELMNRLVTSLETVVETSCARAMTSGSTAAGPSRMSSAAQTDLERLGRILHALGSDRQLSVCQSLDRFIAHYEHLGLHPADLLGVIDGEAEFYELIAPLPPESRAQLKASFTRRRELLGESDTPEQRQMLRDLDDFVAGCQEAKLSAAERHEVVAIAQRIRDSRRTARTAASEAKARAEAERQAQARFNCFGSDFS